MDTKTTSVAEDVCEVIANDWVNAEYKHLVVTASETALTARPGQFFHLLCPTVGADAPFLRRPMSVYAVGNRGSGAGRVEFLYKVSGAGTRAMATLAAGGEINIVGPLGVGFHLDPSWRSMLVVARGVGLATLAPLIETAARDGVAVTAILSARSPALMMSAERLARAGAEVIAVTDAEGTSDVADVERIARGLIADGKAQFLATCGSNRLLQLLQALGREFAIPGQVALEQVMGCGLGMCFCCVREFRTDSGAEYRRVCRDGPVFDLQEALSW